MSSGSQRPAYASLAALGMALLSFVYAVILVVIVASGDTEELGFFGGVLALVAVISWVSWRFDKIWAKALGIVGTLAAGLFTWWLVFGVFQVSSPVEFTLGLVFLAAVPLSLVFHSRAIAAIRRGVPGPVAIERTIARSVLAVVGVGALISVGAFLMTRQSVDATLAKGAVVIDMKNFEFAPDEVQAGTSSTLLVHNADPFVHDFTIEDLDIQVVLNPGSESLVELGSAAGRYRFVCTLHPDMEGVIQVG